MAQTKGYLYGEPIESYTKEQLIEFIIQMNQSHESERQQHLHQLKFLASLG